MPVRVEICDYGGMILFKNGDLYTFGDPSYMPLGRNGTGYGLFKVLSDIVDVELAESMAFAIDKNGDLWGWRTPYG